jgi:hypothetical protein
MDCSAAYISEMHFDVLQQNFRPLDRIIRENMPNEVLCHPDMNQTLQMMQKLK